MKPSGQVQTHPLARFSIPQNSSASTLQGLEVFLQPASSDISPQSSSPLHCRVLWIQRPERNQRQKCFYCTLLKFLKYDRVTVVLVKDLVRSLVTLELRGWVVNDSQLLPHQTVALFKRLVELFLLLCFLSLAGLRSEWTSNNNSTFSWSSFFPRVSIKSDVLVP